MDVVQFVEIVKGPGATVALLALAVWYLRKDGARWLARYEKLSADCQDRHDKLAEAYVGKLEKRDEEHRMVLDRFNTVAGRVLDRLDGAGTSGVRRLSEIEK